MWDRVALKEKAKMVLKYNYWKIVLVTLIIFMIGQASTMDLTSNTSSSSSSSSSIGEDFSLHYGAGGDLESILGQMGISLAGLMAFGGVIVIAVVMILLIVTVISVLLSIFIYSPLEVGARRFYIQSMSQPTEVKEVAFAFDHSYKNVVRILFYRNLYTFLWSLLFVIPGIIKSYEYMMIPYLLAENPNLTQEQAFALSKQMMTGNKFEAFVLDLSFIGWDILSGFTFGLLSIFYVEPYRNLTYAALYEELSLIHGRPAFSAQTYEEYIYRQEETYSNTEEQSQASANTDTYDEPGQEEI